jgi:DNA-binding transcriptional LysR family regulator
MRRVWMERAVLQARGRGDVSARVAMTVPSFTAVPPLLRKSDLIATLPKRLALQAVTGGGLIMFDESLGHESVEVEVAWHSRSATDLGIAWLIDELANAGAELDADA